MSTFLKRSREMAGLTQAQLAEKMGVSTVAVQNWESGKTNISYGRYQDLALILNTPVDKLIKETIIDEDKSRLDNWPDFIFSEDTNKVVDMLHLTMAQQDLFGLLYIYNNDFREYNYIQREIFDDYLNKVPYGFIDRVGSIQFMNQADGLYRVLRHVRKSFLLKALKLNPDSEFNVRKLPKNLICEFIDYGYSNPSELDENGDEYEDDGSLDIDINMRKAKIMLPILEKTGPVHFTDGIWANPIREDIPEEVSDGILESLCITKDAFQNGYRKNEYTGVFAHNLRNVTDYKNKNDNWIWEINDKGRKLLEWFDE